MTRTNTKSSDLTIFALLTAAGVALLSNPADAQTVEELTVTGRLGDAAVLSQTVSYGDLDLTNPAGEDVFKTRIKDTAKDLCRRLGEANPASTPLVPSCEEGAYRDALPQVRLAVASATPRTEMAPTLAVNPPMGSDAEVTSTPASDAAATVPAPTYTVQTLSNGPVPDTAENRRLYGGPMSNAGRRSAPTGN